MLDNIERMSPLSTCKTGAWNMLWGEFRRLFPLDNSGKIVILLRHYGAEEKKSRSGGTGQKTEQTGIQPAIRQDEYDAVRSGTFGSDSWIYYFVLRFRYHCADIACAGILCDNPCGDNLEGQAKGSRLMISGG